VTSTDLAVRDVEVFYVGRNATTINDVICAARFRGELEESWRRVCQSMQSGTNGREAEEPDLQARSEEFRISRDLISAEETERWLGARGLSLNDFTSFLTRQDIPASNSVNPDWQVEEFAFAPPELRESLRVDLLFTGEFDRLAIALAWRMAAREAVSDPPPQQAIESERAKFSEQSGLNAERLDSWLLGLGRDAVWFNEMIELEAIFRRQREELVSVSSRERMLHPENASDEVRS
jgi:hypothetical protein